MANARNHTTFPWPACPAPRTTSASLREPSQGPLSSPRPRPRSCLPAHGGGGAAAAGPPEPGAPWGEAGGIQGLTGLSRLPGQRTQGCAGPSPHPPTLPASSRPRDPAPHSQHPPDRGAPRDSLRQAVPRRLPHAAPSCAAGLGPRVGPPRDGAGRPGVPPPAGETGPAHRSGKV